MLATLQLHAPEQHGAWVRFQASYRHGSDQQQLYFDVDATSAERVDANRIDPFVLAFLPNLLRNGGDIELQATVSEQLLFYLNQQASALLSAFRRNWQPVRFHASSTSRVGTDENRQGHALTGFSGGVDSFFTLHQHRFFPDHNRFRISGLLFNDVGSHGDGERSLRLRQAREDITREFAAEQGFAVHLIRSNINALLHDNFLMTHSLRNTAAALLLQNEYAYMLYSSGYAYPDCSLSAEPQSAARIDPFLLPLIGTEKMEFISAGIAASRTEKTRAISALDSTRRFLNVCTKDIRNCGGCKKCLRTLLTFEVLGKLDDYAEVCDLTAYRQARDAYVRGLRRSRSPLDQEIIALARDLQFDLVGNTRGLSWRSFVPGRRR